MAKLHAELSTHGGGRTVKKSDNTRIVIDAYHKNTYLGALELYQVHDNDTVNVLWRHHGKGFGSEIIIIENSQLK